MWSGESSIRHRYFKLWFSFGLVLTCYPILNLRYWAHLVSEYEKMIPPFPTTDVSAFYQVFSVIQATIWLHFSPCDNICHSFSYWDWFKEAWTARHWVPRLYCMMSYILSSMNTILFCTVEFFFISSLSFMWLIFPISSWFLTKNISYYLPSTSDIYICSTQITLSV